MEAQRETALSPDAPSAACVECEETTTSPVVTRAGASLCAACVAAYYVACARCRGLIAGDEAVRRGDIDFCAECFSAPSVERGATNVDQTLVEALIAEYVSLHAEEKRIGERMEVIKEQLKLAAAVRQREGGSVTLRAGEAAVRCSYRTSLKCDPQSAEALAQMLDEAEFSSLFERKTTFTPVRERIAEFLAAPDESRATAREALRAAVREAETVTLSVVTARK